MRNVSRHRNKGVVLKYLYFLILLLTSNCAIAKVDEYYRYYQNSDKKFGEHEQNYSVYLKYDDPCFFIKKSTEKESKRFCEIGDSGLNLERDSVSIYPVDIVLFDDILSFIVAAPWNEQSCKMNIKTLNLSCKWTGK